MPPTHGYRQVRIELQFLQDNISGDLGYACSQSSLPETITHDNAGNVFLFSVNVKISQFDFFYKFINFAIAGSSYGQNISKS